jgi:N-methylhydantoinase A
MEFYMDIDTGGTFTDGFVRGNGRTELVKVDTTPHDFTICFMECIEEAAKKFGLESAGELLAKMNTLRLSTTIGTNTLIQASGPKLGLLVTRGLGENVYAPVGVSNPAINLLIPENMIIGIDEEISESGESVRAPESSQVLRSVKDLLERGARRIVVSYARSPLNPIHEKRCREIILDDYPAHYLGSVPLLLSTEISSEINDQYRTNAALINAYIHQEMAHYLYKADEDIRNRRCKWPLLIVHANGGAVRVAKTKALDTCDSGPAAGLFGAAFLARLYGIKNVVTVDVGGTSTDIGLIAHNELSYTVERKMSGIPVRERVIETVSIGGGGSSIARLDEKTGKIKVGPESAGAIPGPACYSLGGDKPTVADAWVVLGYIDPDYFLGGRRKLDIEQAREVIKENIAVPLGITVEKAAYNIVEEMNSQSARSVTDFINAKGLIPKDTTMFAFGGAGGLTCADLAGAVGIPGIYQFPFGAQFCAFGSSCTDVLHIYSKACNLPLDFESGGIVIKEFNNAVREMKNDAYFDMEGEGFSENRISLSLDITLGSAESPSPIVIRWAPITLDGVKNITTIFDRYRAEVKASTAKDRIYMRELRLQASSHLADPQFTSYTPVGEDPKEAFKGSRMVSWKGTAQEAKVYHHGLLKCGNVVKGLAFIESAHTTIMVPPGSRYLVDRYLNGVMEEE